ncbi:putative uncharacterized protein [Firmicutes bacterium CAG:822]|nr:putative uncharacterized protein [Firmicutes bacterium CAG:822]
MSTESRSKYTNDFVPIKSITNGVIICNNNEKVTGVKIQPRNIFILEPDMQNMIITNLRNVYNMIDYEFWIIVADRPVDITAYLSRLQLLYNSQTNPVRRKLIMEDINKANLFTTTLNVVDTEYYLLFKEKDMDKIQKKIRGLIQAFANAGLSVTQTSNDDLRIILDNFLNGGMTTTFGTVMS